VHKIHVKIVLFLDVVSIGKAEDDGGDEPVKEWRFMASMGVRFKYSLPDMVCRLLRRMRQLFQEIDRSFNLNGMIYCQIACLEVLMKYSTMTPKEKINTVCSFKSTGTIFLR